SIQRQRSAGQEVALAHALGRAAARGEADLLEQDRERDRERVVDGEVIDVRGAEPGLVERAAGGIPRAVVGGIRDRGEMLMAMALSGAGERDARRALRLGRYHQRHRTVGDRAAVEQL